MPEGPEKDIKVENTHKRCQRFEEDLTSLQVELQDVARGDHAFHVHPGFINDTVEARYLAWCLIDAGQAYDDKRNTACRTNNK